MVLLGLGFVDFVVYNNNNNNNNNNISCNNDDSSYISSLARFLGEWSSSFKERRLPLPVARPFSTMQ